MEGILSIEIEGLIAALVIDDIVPCLELLGHAFRSHDKETNDLVDFREYQSKETSPHNNPNCRCGWHLSAASRHLLLYLFVLSEQIGC